MSRDSCVALPRGAMGLSAVCYCSILDHTHLLFHFILDSAHKSPSINSYPTVSTLDLYGSKTKQKSVFSRSS